MEEKIYNWLLVKKDGTWNGSYNAEAKLKPFCGDSKNYEWIKWNKPLPDDINSVSYKYVDGNLIKV